jgi:hypothetical protein
MPKSKINSSKTSKEGGPAEDRHQKPEGEAPALTANEPANPKASESERPTTKLLGKTAVIVGK